VADTSARKHQSILYTGSNGAAVVAAIPGASLNSGGTGNTLLVIDIAGGGQHQANPGYRFVWTEYPGASAQILDILDSTGYNLVYGGLCDCAALAASIGTLDAAVASIVSGNKLVQHVTGTTDASGLLTVNWPITFSTVPVVATAIQTGTAQMHSTRITANSASSTSVAVLRSPVIVVATINVLGATVAAAGVTVHLIGVAPV
jgi:hypothetical protein